MIARLASPLFYDYCPWAHAHAGELAKRRGMRMLRMRGEQPPRVVRPAPDERGSENPAVDLEGNHDNGLRGGATSGPRLKDT